MSPLSIPQGVKTLPLSIPKEGQNASPANSQRGQTVSKAVKIPKGVKLFPLLVPKEVKTFPLSNSQRRQNVFPLNSQRGQNVSRQNPREVRTFQRGQNVAKGVKIPKRVRALHLSIPKGVIKRFPSRSQRGQISPRSQNVTPLISGRDQNASPLNSRRGHSFFFFV